MKRCLEVLASLFLRNEYLVAPASADREERDIDQENDTTVGQRYFHFIHVM